MKVEVCTVCNTHDTGYRDKVTNSWWVEGDTLEDCFKTVYPSERSLRYCYGYSIKFREFEVHEKYKDWKRLKLTPELYYGGATVD